MAGRVKSVTSSDISLSVEPFDILKDTEKGFNEIKCFTWKNTAGTEIKVINFGACITSICVPDKYKKSRDIAVGFDTLDGYVKPNNPYFGATIGRFANRIGKGKMKIENQEYQLATNNGDNHLHGGIKGFDKVVWDYSITGNQLTLSYLSPDLEEGYPGSLVVNVTFELTVSNMFIINYKAMTTKPTVVNLTNHSYFNLAGNDAGAKELYEHVVRINADHITPVDDSLIPTGQFEKVEGTAFDFRHPVRLGDVINQVPNSPGFDHNFCVNHDSAQKDSDNFVASVIHPATGRSIEVYSDQPGVQFYTGNFLPENNSLPGKDGGFIKKHGAFCLETQIYPDSVNQENFPSPLLYPGEVYETTTKFRFSTKML
ncbi:galactose mutarotase-like [Diabrotica undecimpunctata]|uniref:galactose mutarotase-like n=1 Tax=Diabrotica undecimpunctata TaxID=50387 RepID=UPI003B63AF37